MKIRKSQDCNMIPLQTEVKYEGSSKFLAAWWPLFEGPADFQGRESSNINWPKVREGRESSNMK